MGKATYFDFDTDKLLAIAKQASEKSVSRCLLWTTDGLETDLTITVRIGDWFVNEDKIKGGLKYLVDEVNKLGMKFGMWFEPEMVCPDSELFRAHPDTGRFVFREEPLHSREIRWCLI